MKIHILRKSEMAEANQMWLRFKPIIYITPKYEAAPRSIIIPIDLSTLHISTVLTHRIRGADGLPNWWSVDQARICSFYLLEIREGLID